MNVTIVWPLTGDESWINPIQSALNEHGSSIKLAVIDHISAYPAAVVPVKKLTALLRARGVISIVDAAHAVGQLRVNLTDLDPDVWVATCYKWLFTPKGTAVAYVRKQLQPLVVPAVLSSLFDMSWTLGTKFQYTGTRDYTAFLAVPHALDFRLQLGEDKIIDWNHNLAWKGGLEVARIWNTGLLVADESQCGAMASVRVPSQNITQVKIATTKLKDRFNTFIATSEVSAQPGLIVARLCGQIYLEFQDFTEMAQRFLVLLNES